MAKKKNKKPVPPEVKFKRKVKKNIRRAMLVAAVLAFYFALLPVVVPSLSPQITGQKQTLIQGIRLAKDQLSVILNPIIKQADNLIQGQDSTELEGKEYVEKTVEDLKERIRSLPREQVQKVKREFCADIIEEASENQDSSNSAEDSGNRQTAD